MKNMKTLIITLLSLILITQACNNTHEKTNEKRIETPKSIEKKDNSGEFAPEYIEALNKAIQQFPKDSASLMRFYTRIYDKTKVQKQIQRIKNLLTSDVIERYNRVDHNLKKLLENAVNTNSITCEQSDSIAILYSDFDDFRGDAMCKQVLTQDDNYNLVWKSFQIIAKDSPNDTCYISSLIFLDNHIRTNVELAETMPDFIVSAIQNNTQGFLEMYNSRNGEDQYNFSRFISIYDQPDSTLIKTLNEISANSHNDKYKNAAIEILQNINNMYK